MYSLFGDTAFFWKMEILYEDEYCIVCVKPPKVPSQPDKTGDKSMLDYLEEEGKKVQLVHRLDRPVGGIMVFAKTKKAMDQLSKQMQQNQFKKVYDTIVCTQPKEKEKILKDFLLKNARTNMASVVKENTPDAKEAILSYKVLQTIREKEYPQLSLLKVYLHTGRHHQIRVQLANMGCGIWGDNKYNPLFVKKRGWYQIALWSGELCFYSLKEKKKLQFFKQSEQYPFSLFSQDFYK